MTSFQDEEVEHVMLQLNELIEEKERYSPNPVAIALFLHAMVSQYKIQVKGFPG